MAKWWKTEAWPWIKENWWAVLLAPVAIIIFVLMFLAKNRGGLVLDPLGPADERAKAEAEIRTRKLAEEKKQLDSRVAELEAENRAQQEHMERRVEEEVTALQNDPERLAELMRRVGPGSKP